MSGFLLLRVAAGLRKRKRGAWQIAVGAAFVMTLSHVFRAELRPGEAVDLAAVAADAADRAQSRSRRSPDPHSRWFAARIFLQFVGVALVGGLMLLYAYPHHVAGRPSVWMRAREVLLGRWSVPTDPSGSTATGSVTSFTAPC